MKTQHKEIFHNLLTVAVLGFCFWMLFYILRMPKDEINEHTGDIKIALIGTVGVIVGYVWGSSMGSKKSGDTIRDLVSPPDGTTTMTTKSPTPEGEKKLEDGNIN